ncbi:MAG: hypothetical protein BroJett025_08950 [Patescibacteria group bacterium]|nr:MAG: hypothetical protein BroJett025_08950 [Patescibacteria group bacterium]
MTEAPVFTQLDTQIRFPVLELPKVEHMREEHKALLKRLFPGAVRLQRLIKEIEHNVTEEIASIIGSVDFAHERLAGLLAALKELESQVAAPNYVELNEVREQIRQDHRIHESLEDLVFDCVKHTLDSDLL